MKRLGLPLMQTILILYILNFHEICFVKYNIIPKLFTDMISPKEEKMK